MIDFTGREYYVTGLESPEPHAWENILRADASVILRIWRNHGVAVRYVASHRDARYPFAAYKDQTVGTLFLTYVFLSPKHPSAAVEWRGVE